MARYPDKRILTATVLAALSAQPAHATVSSVSANPAVQRAALDQSSSASIVWSVIDSTFVSGTQTVSATSAAGNFRDVCSTSGTVLGTISTTLTASKIVTNPSATVNTAFVFSESILIPANVVYRAHKLGLSSFVYERTFTPAGASPTACVTLNISSSAAGVFNVSRMALSFDNGTAARVIGRKESLRANAEVNFNGSGLLQAVWEIAGPASTAGEPFYRPIQTVRQYLVGGEKQVLQSPILPTDSTGLYLVRLRVTDPAIPFDAPVIRYFVADERTGARVPALSLSLVTPPHQTLFAPDTTFVWEAIRGARAYQLELYAKPRAPGDTLPDLGGDTATAPPPALPPTPPVTGLLVPGTQTRTPLSATARAHLVSGQSYLWRVLAIGGDGSIVGESPIRELRMP